MRRFLSSLVTTAALTASLSGCIEGIDPDQLPLDDEGDLGRTDQAAFSARPVTVPTVASYVAIDGVATRGATGDSGGYPFATAGAFTDSSERAGGGYLAKGIVSHGVSDLTVSLTTTGVRQLTPLLEDVSRGIATRRLIDVGPCTVADCKAYRQVTNALITEVGFPALDAGSKDGKASFGVKFQADSGTYYDAPIVQSLPEAGPAAGTIGNFSFTLSDLAAANRVTNIGQFSVKLDAATGTAEVTNLKITLPSSQAGAFTDWYRQMVIKGETERSVKSGRIAFLDPRMTTELLAINLKGVGILGFEDVPANGDAIAKTTFTLYVESASIE
jgi:hypothetical protein